jgi:hypothetical protein
MGQTPLLPKAIWRRTESREKKKTLLVFLISFTCLRRRQCNYLGDQESWYGCVLARVPGSLAIRRVVFLYGEGRQRRLPKQRY